MSSVVHSSAESQLVAQYVDGNANSGEALAERLRSQIFYLVRQYTNTTEDAEDLTQECLVRLFECMPSIDSARPLYPWLAAIVRNVSVNWIRQKSRSVSLPLQTISDDIGNAVTIDTAIHEHLAILESILSTLDNMDRELLELRYYYELGYAEIGAKLGLGAECVRKRISRALDRLQRDERMKSLLEEEVKM